MPVSHFEPRIKDHGSLRRASVYPYGIARNRLIESAKRFNLPLRVVDTLDEADVLLTLKNFYRRRQRLISDAEQCGVPIYVLRSNTVTQIEDFLIDFFNLEVEAADEDDIIGRALREAREGIQAVLNGAPSIDLLPQEAGIRRRQQSS